MPATRVIRRSATRSATRGIWKASRPAEPLPAEPSHPFFFLISETSRMPPTQGSCVLPAALGAHMTRWSSLFLVVGACGLASAAACSRTTSDSPADATAAAASSADNDWSKPNKNQSATRYSAVSEITADNVKNLKVAWSFSTGVLRGHEGEPIVVGSTMYVHTPFPNNVYALDLSKEGAPVKWKYTPKQDAAVIPVACCDTVNRGVTYSNGKIFLNQLDTHTVALDAETGKELWKVKQGDYRNGQTMTSAPMVVKDKVISGVSR